MYTFTVRADIYASPACVWRALCDPAEVVRWDSDVEQALDAPADYPQPSQHVRWRYRSGPFRILHDRPQEVKPMRKLRSELSLGPLKFSETYALEQWNGACRLTTTMAVWALLPLVGAIVERLYVGPQSRRTAEASLQAIKAHCEKDDPDP